MIVIALSQSPIPLKHRYGGVPEAAPSAALDGAARPAPHFFGPHQPIHAHTLRGGIVADCIAAGLCDGALSEEVQVNAL